MRTRFPRLTSPLVFDPEIEKTARQNRVLHRSGFFIAPIAQDIEEATSSSSTTQPASMDNLSDEFNYQGPNNQNPPQDENPP
jgi:hypothetical protein